MDRSKKIYIKALDKYNEGYIDKAIELCEESISIDIKNTAAINLKGLLYYLKGDLEKSQKLWKMNLQINQDSVSRKYLIDTKEDDHRIKLYKQALNYIKELKINDALNTLENCLGSDFNFINVNNYIALCYIKKGEHHKAIKYINKVLKLDKNNRTAKDYRRMLQTLGIIRSNPDLKKIIYILLIILCITSLCLLVRIFSKQISSGYLGMKNKIKLLTLNKYDNFKKKSSEIDKKDNTSNSSKTNNYRTTDNRLQESKFPVDRVNTDIQNKSFEDIYEVNEVWRNKNISINEKTVLLKGDELLKSEGTEYFYNKGCAYISNKDYINAKESFVKAYNIGQQNYLYPHILYMLGNSLQLSGDVENAVKYYNQYIDNYSNGNYAETVLYNLVIIYKEVDKSKAQIYAKKLASTYPYSIYNNSIIADLIK